MNNIKFLCKKEDHILYIDLKYPYIVNFVGNPLYLVLAGGDVFLPRIKFSGMLIPQSYEDFSNGYTIQIPVNMYPKECLFKSY